MDITKLKESVPRPLRQATLVFALKEREILLAMKKRGFGIGLWNGVGGKVDKHETVEAAAKREAFEEVAIKLVSLQHVASIDFFFPLVKLEKDWNQRVEVFFATEWTGDPQESDEMQPQWFSQDNLPLDLMWPDDKFWLPVVLDGYFVKAEFTFGEQNTVLELNVTAKQR